MAGVYTSRHPVSKRRGQRLEWVPKWVPQQLQRPTLNSRMIFKILASHVLTKSN
jgi:hypothetical protein